MEEICGRDVSIETRSYVDTGPVVERVYAKYAGVRWIGKNTCIINQKIGSWLFLGVIVTSIELSVSEAAWWAKKRLTHSAATTDRDWVD